MKIMFSLKMKCVSIIYAIQSSNDKNHRVKME